jgi:3-methyladenine DNA glycosylase AlkD
MDLVAKVRNDLRENSDEKTRTSAQGFFRETVKVYGVRSAVVERIGKDNFKTIREAGRTRIFELCEQFWQSGFLEESFIACNWSYFVHNDFEPDDLMIFERWILSYVNNWASCDTLCNHTVGAILEKFPETIRELKRWTGSGNRWLRRASAVSLIVPARKGMFLKDIFAIAGKLMKDKDDMVQKGYGWMLKVASQVHQKEVFDYVMQNKKLMPRTSLRYAIEKMPAEMKKKAMER